MYIKETASSPETNYQETFASALNAWHAIRDDLAISKEVSKDGPDDAAGKFQSRSLRRTA